MPIAQIAEMLNESHAKLEDLNERQAAAISEYARHFISHQEFLKDLVPHVERYEMLEDRHDKMQTLLTDPKALNEYFANLVQVEKQERLMGALFNQAIAENGIDPNDPRLQDPKVQKALIERQYAIEVQRRGGQPQSQPQPQSPQAIPMGGQPERAALPPASTPNPNASIVGIDPASLSSADQAAYAKKLARQGIDPRTVFPNGIANEIPTNSTNVTRPELPSGQAAPYGTNATPRGGIEAIDPSKRFLALSALESAGKIGIAKGTMIR